MHPDRHDPRPFRVSGRAAAERRGSLLNSSALSRLITPAALAVAGMIGAGGAAQAACTAGPAISCTGTTTFSGPGAYVVPGGTTSWTSDIGSTTNFDGRTTIASLPYGFINTPNASIFVNGTIQTTLTAPNDNWFMNVGTGATTIGSTGLIRNATIESLGSVVINAGGQLLTAGTGGTHVASSGNGSSVTVNGVTGNHAIISGHQTGIFFANGVGQQGNITFADITSRSAQVQQFNSSNATVNITDSTFATMVGQSVDERHASIRIISGNAGAASTGNTYNITRTSITSQHNGIAIDSWNTDATGGNSASNNTFNLTDSTLDSVLASIAVDGGTGNTFNLNGTTRLTSATLPTVVVNAAGAYSLLAEGGNVGTSAQTFTLNMNDSSSLNATVGGIVFVGGVGMQTVNMRNSAAANGAMNFGADADALNLYQASTFGNVDMGTGSDTVLVQTSGYDGSQILNGGDGVATGDGWIDTLTLDGRTVTTAGANLLNWENIIVNGGRLTISDGALTTGSDAGTGMIVRGGGTLDGLNSLALTGNLTLDPTGTFEGTGGGAGVYSISRNLSNSGIVTTQDGAVGDTVAVGENYIGGGQLLVDANVDTLTSDMLIITGDVTGATTLISVNNLGAVGSNTGTGPGAGIAVVDVSNTGNTAAGDFALAGGALSVGAYTYRLNLETDGIWYLQSALMNQVPVYEAYSRALLGLGTLPTMQQRIGNRWYWPNEVEQGSGPGEGGPAPTMTAEGSGIWTRLEASHAHVQPSTTTTGSSFDQNQWRVQAGADGLLKEWDDGGRLFVGLNAHYGTASTNIASAIGGGDIDTTGYGIGGTLTWLGASGAYVDLQGQATWLDSDITSAAVGALARGNNGFAHALSAEVGRKFDWRQDWTLTPQAQLIYTSVDFDTFTDPAGVVVSTGDADSLRLRMGIAVDRDVSWTGDNGKMQRSHIYGIANLIHEFNPEVSTVTSGTTLASTTDDWTGELGIGFTRNFNDDKYSLYGEANVSTGLDNFGDSYRLGGTIGARLKF